MWPSHYRSNPMGWAKQMGALYAIGQITAVLACYGWLLIAGEYPYRYMVFAVMVLVFGIRQEFCGCGWQLGNTLENAIGFTIWGAGPILYAFREVSIGSGRFDGQIHDLWPFAVFIPVHFMIGFGVRYWQLWGAARGR